MPKGAPSRPLRMEAFLAKLETRTGRIVRRRKPGPNTTPQILVWSSRCIGWRRAARNRGGARPIAVAPGGPHNSDDRSAPSSTVCCRAASGRSLRPASRSVAGHLTFVQCHDCNACPGSPSCRSGGRLRLAQCVASSSRPRDGTGTSEHSEAAVVNGWDVRPVLERKVACSSGRVVPNRLITAPGPDSAPPAAYLRASTEHAGHPVAASTAACGGRLGGGPAHDDALHRPRPCTGTDGDTPPRHIPLPTSLRDSPACRAVWLYAAGILNHVQPPQVAPASRSKLAPNPRSV